MKIFYRVLTVIICLNIYSEVSAQVVSDLLISRIDNYQQYELADGSRIKLMGYVKSSSDSLKLPAPTLIYNEGDSVELDLFNFSQPGPHTIHLHGLDVDQQNDGVGALSFFVHHGETKTYKFVAPHPGTYIYHCHVISPVHVQAGMYGLLIVKPTSGSDSTWTGGYAYDSEYAWMTSEVDTIWHTDAVMKVHDSSSSILPFPDYMPQHYLINGKSEQQIDTDESIVIHAPSKSQIYLRLANIGNLGNRFVFPSALNVKIISSDGRPLPSVEVNDTLEVMPGERYGVLFNPTTQFIDSVLVQYINLNTSLVDNEQYVPVNIGWPLGLLNNSMINKDLDIYPNPATNKIFVKLKDENATIDKLLVYNVSGETIFELPSQSVMSEIQIDASQWMNGIYFVRLISDGKDYIKRVAIIR